MANGLITLAAQSACPMNAGLCQSRIGEQRMSSALMFMLAVAAFAWGLALSVYRWIAFQNAWPMGAWQAERPLVSRLIGLVVVAIALGSGAALGGASLAMVVLFGLTGTLLWLLLLRVGAQSALLFAPAAAALMLLGWVIGVG
jgi:hypothetical protein